MLVLDFFLFLPLLFMFVPHPLFISPIKSLFSTSRPIAVLVFFYPPLFVHLLSLSTVLLPFVPAHCNSLLASFLVKISRTNLHPQLLHSSLLPFNCFFHQWSTASFINGRLLLSSMVDCFFHQWSTASFINGRLLLSSMVDCFFHQWSTASFINGRLLLSSMVDCFFHQWSTASFINGYFLLNLSWKRS